MQLQGTFCLQIKTTIMPYGITLLFINIVTLTVPGSVVKVIAIVIS